MITEFKFPDVGEGITEGEVVSILVKEGDSVRADQPLFKIKTDERPASVVGELEEAKEPMEMPKHEYSAKSIEKRVLALPSVRKLASQLNVDLIKVKGTGKDNSITEKDVKDFSEGKTSALEEHVEYKGKREN